MATWKAGNQTGPIWPWHFPFQLYLTLRIVDPFSTLWKLLGFLTEWNTYIAAIFLKSVCFSLGHLSWWCHYLILALSANIGGKQMFGLAAVWAHPCQGCLTTLVEVACKLALLISDGPDWPYAFICMSSMTHHMPLSDAGHLGAMTESVQSVNMCGHLHQLQTRKLLQHREHVVFPEGLNGVLEAHYFSFSELPPWDFATTGRSAGELPPIEGVEHESMLTIPHSSASLAPASHHDTLGGKLPYEDLGDLTPSQTKDLLSLEETDSPLHVPMATSPWASLGNATPRDSSIIVQVSDSPSPATVFQSPGAASTSSDHQPHVPAKAGPSNTPQEVAQFQKWNEYGLRAATVYKSCPELLPKGARAGSWLCHATIWCSGCQGHPRSGILVCCHY